MMSGTSKSLNKRILFKLLCLIIAIMIVFPFSFSVFAAPPTLREKFNLDEKTGEEDEDIFKDFVDYSDMLELYEKNNYTSPNVDPIVLKPDDAVRSDGKDPKISSGYEGRNESALIWDDKALSYEWVFNVPVSGLYEISVEYIPIGKEIMEIQRRLLINGESRFRQMENIFFNRKWEEMEEVQTDKNGDERSPRLRQVYEWSEAPVIDSKAMYTSPLKFYFEQGENKLTFEYISANMAVGNIYIKPVEEIISYDKYINEYKGKNEYKGEPITIEAEKARYRSHQVLRRNYNSDPSTSPEPKGKIKQNVIGNGWNAGNKDITWVVDVPEDGLYRLAFRVYQGANQGITSHRQILIDGKVPFKEAEAYPFEYVSRWITQEIDDENGEPYLFWLEKGQREITLRVKTGPITPFLNEIERLNLELSKTIRQITKITSTSPDVNFDYELFKKIEGLEDTFKDYAKRLRKQADYLLGMSSKRPVWVNSLISAAEEIETLIKHPDRIPRKLNDLNTMQNTLSNVHAYVQSQGMLVDYVQLVAVDEEPKDFQSTFWQKLVVSFRNFIQSFFKDYDNPLGDNNEHEDENFEVIDVWVAREKQWAELIQQLTREEFTPEHKINVNLNILPSGTAAGSGTSPLMLSIISGKAPDVALGSDGGTPVELAIREATYDLSQFPDFEEVKKRFLPGLMIPFEYEGGTYALPETMDFSIMYYRTDVMNELGLEVPQTWDELFSKTLPIIRQSGAHMLMPADFTMFLFQNGGEYYKDNNRKTALDSDAAYDAFLKWTNAYTVYRMTAAANLLQHFRLGSIPLFVSPVNTYITITHAAPELYGKWDIALIPGTPKPDGTIDRTAAGGAGSVLMFSKTKNPEAGWKYLKWWTSAEIQTRFGQEIESTIGPEARWMSANIEAFEAMNWDAEHLEVMREAMKWVKNPPNVLGGYYTGRMIQNAWTRVVMVNMNPRDSLEQAIKEINRELDRKNEEYDKIYGRNKRKK